MRLSHDTAETVVGVGLMLLILAVIISALVYVNATQCEKKWARSGFKSEWALFQGCLVQRKDGTWVPAETIRELTP